MGAAAHGYHTISFEWNEQRGEHRGRKLFIGTPLFQPLQYPSLFPAGAGGWESWLEKDVRPQTQSRMLSSTVAAIA